ncbi:MAG: phage tail protein [Janthinobacterium lividum]
MENYIGEIRVFGGSYAPEGWALCNGSLLNISDNETLFALIGTTYGGDGVQTFALPDLRSRVVVSQGTNYSMGQTGGQEAVALTSGQMPLHQHPIASLSGLTAQTGGKAQTSPQEAYFGSSGSPLYQSSGAGTSLAAGALTAGSSVAGSSAPHSNIQPCLAINYIIALTGYYPSFE